MAFGSGLVVFLLTTAADATAEAASRPTAERLDHIERLIVAANFDEAEAETRTLLATGRLTRTELARAHLELGIVHSARGENEKADRALRNALRLDVSQALPDFAGPHVHLAFAKARGEIQSEPALHAEVALLARGSTLEVQASVDDGSDGIAAKVILQGPRLRRVFAFRPGERTLVEEVRFVANECQTFVAAVTDEFENTIWPQAASVEACPETAEVPAPRSADLRVPPAPDLRAPSFRVHRPIDATPPSGDVPTQVWIAGGVAASLAVGTVVLGTRALDARSEYHASLSDPQRTLAFRVHLRERALAAQHRATLAAALAVAAGTTTGLLYVFRAGRGPAAGVALDRGMVGLAAAGNF
jgi:hypothetical protein